MPSGFLQDLPGFMRTVWNRAGSWEWPSCSGEEGSPHCGRGTKLCSHCLLEEQKLKVTEGRVANPVTPRAQVKTTATGERDRIQASTPGEEAENHPELIPVKVSYCWGRSKITRKPQPLDLGRWACLQSRLNVDNNERHHLLASR